MIIRRLDDSTVNRIAAGEVIERPASVVKELLENAIDANCSRVEIVTAGGGKNLIRVTDDGHGMPRDDLDLCVERHCTSKLDANDITDIRSLGFRGEALPSISSVARVKITTRHRHEDNAWELQVDGGERSDIRPAALSVGTRIEIEDLFFATPARLKFLKSDRSENNAISDVVKRLAMAHPDIRFSLNGPDRSALEYSSVEGSGAYLVRLGQVMGRGFRENAVEIDAVRDDVRLTGFAGLPTFNRGNGLQQFLFVNDRPVRDKMMLGALRGAYADFLARGRHPVVALFIDCPPAEVDVNVHPTKADVRFRDPAHIRGLIVGAIRKALQDAGHRSSTVGGDNTVSALRPDGLRNSSAVNDAGAWSKSINRPLHMPDTNGAGMMSPGYQDRNHGFEEQSVMAPVSIPSADARAGEAPVELSIEALPLGAARAQIHENYIVAQTRDGMIIVDQHAAHERLVYEKLKNAMLEKGIASQILLIPDIIELDEVDADRLAANAKDFEQFGLVLERFGPGAIAVRETPAILGEVNTTALVQDLADELAEWDSSSLVKERLDHVAATMACHGSIRSGRRMRSEEMNALLREMEATPHSGQCNHGRPTYVELKLHDIERLFGRH
ncbi:MAG: DNA mismatch repair endonuclease MutL [Cohaesibacteraceae bacterium]|nr:DNA mismatch repair endonuclease MutL [Cohaesibacteraceae bacterium]